MKRKTLTCLVILMSSIGLKQADAQYAQASPYFVPGTGYFKSQSQDIIGSDAGTTVTLGRSYNAGDYLILKRLGIHGGVMFNKVFGPNDPNGRIFPDKLIETQDKGLLVVGLYRNDTLAGAPFAAKFDPAGNFQWFNFYPNSNFFSSNNFSRTNVVLAGCDSQEDYIIQAIAGPDDTSSYFHDVFVDALKIDNKGNLLWHNKYVPAFDRSGFSAIHDYASTISFIPQGNDKFKFYNSSFLIAGAAEWWSIGPEYFLFYLGIDSAGNLIKPYTAYTVPGYPFNVSSIFDPNPSSQAVCLGYTFGNPGIISPTTASTIALTKISPFYYIFSTRYYCIPAVYATENYGCSIAKTHDADSGYIIGTTSFFNNPPSPFATSATGLLKISQNGTPDFYNQFNITRDWTLTTQVADVQFGGTEYYAVAATSVDNTSSTMDIHIIATDVNGYTCDTTCQPIIDTTYDAIPKVYDYTAIPETGMGSDMLIDLGGHSDDATCHVPHPSFRALMTQSAIASPVNVDIYPTLINSDADLMHIDCTSASGGKLFATVYTVDGKLISSYTFDLAEGENPLRWNLSLPNAGTYLLQVSMADKSFNKTVRISKQ